MAIFDFIGDKSTSGGLPGALARILLRSIQFILAITVAGLYGTELHRYGNVKDENHVYYYGRWVFAEVVAILSVITVLVYAIPFIKSWWGFVWDWCLFILWTALFGVFGHVYIGVDLRGVEEGARPFVRRMNRAVWIDLVNMLLWFVTAVYLTVIWFRNRGSGRTLHTGRGQV
ncbi:hypothetical protein LTR17_007348 [Elasticomyces elasticus]|nr:hypothetical protein LTR17_007348 [Elasticomyces elasticus]